MYYEDLSPYRYRAAPTGLPGVLNIGWLSSQAPIARGQVELAARLKIADLAEARVFLTRGYHVCDFCGNFKGNGEIWIACDDGRVYASPGMLLHYIEKHNYVPPPLFLEAVHRATAALAETDCSAIIDAHWHKLDTAPTPEDILVPFYSTEIFWQLSAFEDLTAFVAFIDETFPWRFSSYAVNDIGYLVRTACERPDELLSELVAHLKHSNPQPFQCTSKLVNVGGDEQVYLNPLIEKPPTRQTSLRRWLSKLVSGSFTSA